MAEYMKWNEEKRVYEPYIVPDQWRLSTYETDMDARVNCCHCGREVAFGECYTSLQVQTPVGFGYAVCGDCYFGKEVPERANAKEMSAHG